MRFKVYLACIKTAFVRATAYRTDFLLSTIITLLSNILFPIVTIVIYANGLEFPGWTMWEVLALQSIFSMSNGIASMCLSSVLWATMDHVRGGSFETVLLKPVSPLFYIVTTNFSPSQVGLFVGGLVVLIVSLVNTGVSGIWGVLSAFVLFIGGIIASAGFYLIMAAISFIWVGNSRLDEISSSITSFGNYPIGIFSKGLGIVISFVVPAAMIGSLPAQVLLKGTEPLYFLGLIPCGLVFTFGIWIYNRMIRRYEGVGG
ncbi:MAG: ABC-2 family transporter protein [Lachnospiraceae bacterium]|nr:ABC-2 family transporter protein [Lachnospiraceae bacterium]